MKGAENTYKLTAREKLKILKQEYPDEKGMQLMADRMVQFHLKIEEIQRKREAEGYEFGWVKGQFVVLKTPEQKTPGGYTAAK